MMIVQFGIAGFVLLVGLFVTQWRLAARLPGRFEPVVARALVLTIAVASVLSSTLVDHAEGLFFVYMSGLLFAGYPAGGRDPRRIRRGESSGHGARAPALAAPASVLVVVTRRMGDVLLASPLIRSIKAAWPQTGIDVLVFAGTQGVLATNPDVRRVITVAERPGILAHLAFAAGLLRRYDIALSCLAGDRPTAYAVLAGRWRAGMVEPENGARWKRWVLSRAVAFDDLDTHTVAMNLALAEVMGIARHHEFGIGWSAEDAARAKTLLGDGARDAPYAVLHVHPKFNYKMWHVEGWVGLAHWLARARVRHGPHGRRRAGREGVRDVRRGADARRNGQSGGAADASRRRRASLPGRALFVGPDTVTTHLAAALGVPTVALYGPSNPVKWGPWPRRFAGARSPWQRVGTQAMGNVQLVQGAGACVPCLGEGCDRHVASFSDCLQQLPLPAVIAAAERALAGEPPSRGDATRRSARIAPARPSRQREQERAGHGRPQQEHGVGEPVEVQQVAVRAVEQRKRRAREQEVRQQHRREQR